MDDNPFWQYSLNVYKKTTVSSRVLHLQDQFTIDVNAVLFCCWLGECGIQVKSSLMKGILSLCDDWRKHALLPVRSARKFLKSQSLSSDLYDQAKKLELQLERVQQDIMFREILASNHEHFLSLCQSRKKKHALILENIQVYIVCAGCVEWCLVEGEFRALLSEIDSER